MQGIAIELGIHGNRRDSHFSGGTDDTNGDFASIGYQDLFQHGLLSLPDEHSFSQPARKLGLMAQWLVGFDCCRNWKHQRRFTGERTRWRAASQHLDGQISECRKGQT